MHSRRLILALLLAAAPLLPQTRLLAQAAPTATSASDVPTGSVLFDQPGRDKSGDEPFDVPELYGSRPHTLRSGERLPDLLAEYVVRSGKLYQRISVFGNGVAVVHLRAPGGDASRRLQLADEPIDTIRKLVATIDLHATRSRDLFRDPEEYAELRLMRDGTIHQLALGANQVLPQTVESVRQLMGDLLDALILDRQITNPVTEYTASIGDRLVSEDGRTYRVTRLIENGSVIELEMTNKPLRLVIPADMLNKMFVDFRRAESASTE